MRRPITSISTARANLVDVAGLGEVERPDHAVDHRDRDLKSHVRGKQALVAQRAKYEIRVGCVAGVAEAQAWQAEAHALHARPHPELPALAALARQQLLDAVDLRRPPQGLEIGMSVEQEI